MIVGVGLEIVEIGRVRDECERRGEGWIEEVLLPAELDYCRSKQSSYAYYAVRLAAKEACAKALGGPDGRKFPLLDLEVVRNEDGKPSLNVSGEAQRLAGEQGVTRFHLSLTHARDHAAAAVVLESDS